MPTVCPLEPKHLQSYIEHLARHHNELGIDDAIVQPYLPSDPFYADNAYLKTQQQWQSELTSRHWKRTWGVIDGDKVVGHLDLVSNKLPSMQHRCRLGLGVEKTHRSQGFGKQLMSQAIQWAKQQDFLQWIDLDVFSHNTVALNLYKQFEFILIGTTPDRFRMGNLAIDDHQMTLDLRQPAPEKINTPPQIFNLENLEHQELYTKIERLSLSSVLTDLIDFRTLFVHHEILPPGRRASSPHYHTRTEEMFLILEGHPTIFCGDTSYNGKPGDFIGFQPGDRQLHYIQNFTNHVVRILGICADHPLDRTKYSID